MRRVRACPLLRELHRVVVGASYRILSGAGIANTRDRPASGTEICSIIDGLFARAAQVRCTVRMKYISTMEMDEFETTLRSLTDAVSRITVLGLALGRLADGLDLPPELSRRLDDAVLALGGIPEGLSKDRACLLAASVSACLGSSSQALLVPAGSDETVFGRKLMNAVGRTSTGFATVLNQAGSELDGLMERLNSGTARILDVGVGVAAQAIAVAHAFPSVSIVGIDVSEPALTEARSNVAATSCEGRVILRLQDVRMLEDVSCFDLVKHSPSFMPEQVVRESMLLLLRSLHPGGWLLLPFTPAGEATWSALTAFRTVLAGGYPWTYNELAELLNDTGLEEVRLFASGSASFAAGRKPIR